MNKVFTDRSRIEEFQRCPRKRYLTYAQSGRGIVPVKTPLPLAVGASVHVGLAVLLELGQRATTDYNGLRWMDERLQNWSLPATEENAVAAALEDFQKYTRVGLELDAFERQQQAPAAAQAQLIPTPSGPTTYEDQLLAQARAMGMTDEEVAQYAQALQRNKSAGQAGAGEFERYLEAEQSALVEAMVRAYARRRLRPLLEQFEVLEVEREGTWKLSEWRTPRSPSGIIWGDLADPRDIESDRQPKWDEWELWFMSRPDALLRERQSNQLYLLSFKTTSQWDRRKEADAQHDMQGLSEGVEVERRLGQWWGEVTMTAPEEPLPKWANDNLRMYNYLASLTAAPRILGIRYEYLLKGERWKDKDLTARFGVECRSQKTPLLRQYVATSTPKRGEAAYKVGDVCWSWDFKKEDGTNGTLAWQNWRSQPLAETAHWPVKEWIDKLGASEPAMSAHDPTVGLPPRQLGYKSPAQAMGYTEQHPLDSVFVPPIVVTRNDDDLRDLFESVEAQERRVAEAQAQIAQAGDEGERRSLMNQHFPLHRHSCIWPSECVFVKVCYAADEEMRRNPLGSGQFKERVPNHPVETKVSK